MWYDFENWCELMVVVRQPLSVSSAKNAEDVAERAQKKCTMALIKVRFVQVQRHLWKVNITSARKEDSSLPIQIAV